MPRSNTVLIHKLQQAINSKGDKILYATSQFFSEKENRPVTVYHIKKAFYDIDKQRNKTIELYKSSSQIRILLFLRDYLYKLEGKELPTDNEEWNEIRKKIEEENE